MMRKQKMGYLGLMLCMCVLMMFALCCCTTKKHKETEASETDLSKTLPDVVFPKDQFFIHVYGEAKENLPQDPDADADQEVCMRYFTRKTDPEVSVVRMDNQKAQTACKGVTQKQLDTVMYRGFHYMELKLKFDFSCLEYGETLAVNSITLSVGGEECTVDTTDRLFLTRWTKEEENAQTVANQRGVQISEVTEAGFSLQGNAYLVLRYKDIVDTVIEKIEIDDWYEIMDSHFSTYEKITTEDGRVEKKRTDLGTMEEALPVTISPGQELSVGFTFSAKNGTPFSNYRTQLKLYYRTNSGTEGILYQTVEAKRPDHYNDEDEAAMWMDAYVAPSIDALEKTVFLEEYMYEDLVLLAGKDSWGQSSDTDGGFILIYFLYEDVLPYIRLESINGKLVSERDYLYMMPNRDINKNEEPCQGYRLARLEFQLDYSDMKPGTHKEIESIGLSVNGAMTELNFKGRLHYERAKDGALIGDISRGISVPQTEYCAFWITGEQNPLAVESMEFYGPLAQEKIRVVVDGNTFGTPEEVFPLTLYEGQEMQIYVKFDLNGVDPYAMCNFSALLHVHEEAGEERTYRRNFYLLGFQFDSYNPRNTQKFIDHALQMKKDHT